MRTTLLILYILFFFASIGAATTLPWPNPPDPITWEVVSQSASEGIVTKTIYINSIQYKGKTSKIFGYFSFPRKAINLPAILISHGGGGHAVLSRNISWANRGYAVLSIDLPGKGENRSLSKSTGPNMTVSQLLKTMPLDENYLCHAVAAVRSSISFLAAQKEVDPQNIGMIGLSWGGVLTLLTNGVDSRIKTFINVYGSGHIQEESTWQSLFDKMSEGERQIWDSLIDPKNVLSQQKSEMLFMTGTNDHCYYLPIFQKSYIESETYKNLMIFPNIKHKFFGEQIKNAWLWFDLKLKGKGEEFPRIIFKEMRDEGENIALLYKFYGFSELRSARLVFNAGFPSSWTEKIWETKRATIEAEEIKALISKAMINPEILFYTILETKTRGQTSSLVQSIFKAENSSGNEDYILTTPITQTHLHPGPYICLKKIANSESKIKYEQQKKKYIIED